MYHNFFIHSSIDGHPGCSHVLAIVNSAEMNNEIHVSFSILVSSGYMPRSGLAESYRGSIPNFLRKQDNLLGVSNESISHSSHLILCDPMDCSSPGSSVHGILQVRILEWVAIPFSRGSSQSRDQT